MQTRPRFNRFALRHTWSHCPITLRTTDNLTIGASTNRSELYVGDCQKLRIGLHTSFRLKMTRTAGDAFGNLQVWVDASCAPTCG